MVLHIMKTLDSFNFGTSIKRWVSTFDSNVESAVLNNGCSTNSFKPSEGVRQGCPLSPYLFILSIKICYEPTVKGISIFGNELKLSQFADDTNIVCADLVSVENALRATVCNFRESAVRKRKFEFSFSTPKRPFW